MTKGQYLDRLSESLLNLPEEKVQEIIADIYAHFEDGRAAGISEEDIAKGLGSPEELAREYLKTCGDEAPPRQDTAREWVRGDRREEAYVEEWHFSPEDALNVALWNITLRLISITLVVDVHDGADVMARFDGVRFPNSDGEMPYIRFTRNGDDILAEEIYPQTALGGLLAGLLGTYPRLRGTLYVTLPREIGRLISNTTSGKQLVRHVATTEARLQASSGAIEGEQLTAKGDIQVNTNSGSQRLTNVKGQQLHGSATSGGIIGENIHVDALRIQANSGALVVTDAVVTGDVHMQTSSGAIRLSGIQGDNLTIQRNSGALKAESLQAKTIARITATSGTSYIHGLKAELVEIHHNSGSLSLGDVSFGVKCALEATSGSIQGENITGAELSLRGISGAIHLSGIAADKVAANASSGGIRLHLVKDADLSLGNASGQVKVVMPASAEFAYDIETASGGIEIGYPTKGAMEMNKRSARGTVGGGIRSVKVRTASGRVRILPE